MGRQPSGLEQMLREAGFLHRFYPLTYEFFYDHRGKKIVLHSFKDRRLEEIYRKMIPHPEHLVLREVSPAFLSATKTPSRKQSTAKKKGYGIDAAKPELLMSFDADGRIQGRLRFVYRPPLLSRTRRDSSGYTLPIRKYGLNALLELIALENGYRLQNDGGRYSAVKLKEPRPVYLAVPSIETLPRLPGSAKPATKSLPRRPRKT